MKKIIVGIILCFVALLLVSGCGMFRSGQPEDQFGWEHLFEDPAPGAEQGMDAVADEDVDLDAGHRRISSAYRLQFDDFVSISLLGVREFQGGIEARVDENGEISMPYIDNVKAEGKTSSELANYIKEIFIEKGIYKNINVKVIIPAQNSYYIRGEVRRPGDYPWKAGLTLSQAISSAAGVTEYASKKIYLTRKGTVETYDIREIEEDPSKDVVLMPDDQIRVRRSIF